MARKRMIDPGFWEDEHLGECSRDARLLFVGLWCLADDTGRVNVNPVGLQRALFGFDHRLKPDTIRKWLTELDGIGCITLYGDGKHELAWIRNFQKYQYLKPPFKSNYPPHPDDSSAIQNNLDESGQIQTNLASHARAGALQTCTVPSSTCTEPVPSSTPSRKPRAASAAPDPNVKILIDHYHAEFIRLHPDVKPKVRGPADGKAVKELLRDYEPGKLRNLMTKYLETTNHFYQEKGYPIWLFARDIVGIELGDNNGHRGSASTTRSQTEAERKHEELKREFAGT